MPEQCGQRGDANTVFCRRFRRFYSHFEDQIVSSPRLTNRLGIGWAVVQEKARLRQLGESGERAIL